MKLPAIYGVSVVKTVLLIEDDKNIALALKIRLNANGYRSVVAYDADDGLAAAINQDPDLVIMDIGMPKGNGIDVARSMKAIESTCNIPVVFVTANSNVDLRRSARGEGAAGFFEKPFDSALLMNRIAELIEVNP
jgi:DNA-binding response OmpR family regulator